MKKYTTPSMEVLEFETEGGIMNTSISVNTSNAATSVHTSRNRGNDWSDYDGME
jgi:hypothetical protein